MSCRYKEECPSYTGWCEGPKQDFSQCIPFLITSREHWKHEAQKQAADAGEMRIALAEHLNKLRVLIQNSKRRVQREEGADVREHVFYCTRATVLQSEYDWLKKVLAEGYRIGGDANGNQ